MFTLDYPQGDAVASSAASAQAVNSNETIERLATEVRPRLRALLG